MKRSVLGWIFPLCLQLADVFFIRVITNPYRPSVYCVYFNTLYALTFKRMNYTCCPGLEFVTKSSSSVKHLFKWAAQ